jgi:hypothetical protein
MFDAPVEAFIGVVDENVTSLNGPKKSRARLGERSVLKWCPRVIAELGNR